MRIAIVAVLVLCCVLSVWVVNAVAGCGEITLVSSLTIPGLDYISDVWGYTDPQTSKRYALVGEVYEQRFYIVDVTDPANPFLETTVTGVPSFDIKAWDHFVYTCTDENGSSATESRVVDISDISNPLVLNTQYSAAHNITISDDGFMFLEKCCPMPGSMEIYNLNSAIGPPYGDPTDPVFVWAEGLGSNGHDATVKGDRLYDFSGGDKVVHIYDISSLPSTPPPLLGTVDHENNQWYTGRFAHSGDATDDHQYLYLCDELAFTENRPEDVYIWDISDVDEPQFVTTITDALATVHNLYIMGDFAFASYYTAGFRVYSVKDPSQPVLLDEYDTSTYSGETELHGAFGVYPFDDRGYVYVSDMENGLYVFDVEGHTGSPTIVISGRIEDTYDNPVSDVRVDAKENSVVVATDYTDSNGYYSLAVNQGFDGLVKPKKGGWSFTFDATGENHADYVCPESNQTAQHYTGNASCPKCPPPHQELPGVVPAQTKFLGIKPNPFNPVTEIQFQVNGAAETRITIYNVAGQHVRTAVPEVTGPGVYSWKWDGRSDAGEPLHSGVYFVSLRVGEYQSVKKAVLLK